MAVIGHIVTRETREKLRLANLGKKLSEETKRKIGMASMGNHYMLGHRHSIATRRKMSLSKKGVKFTDSHRKAFLGNKHMLGKKHSEKTKKKMSISRRGNLNGNWKNGVTPINRGIRTSKKYKLWRDKVYRRDKYTCVSCGKKNVYLNADHIKPFALYPRLRFRVSNGRTLCVPCHRQTDTYAGKCRKNYA